MENFQQNFKNIFKNLHSKIENNVKPFFNFYKDYILETKSSTKYDNIPFDDANYKKIIVYVSGEKNIEYINNYTSKERNKMFNEFIELAQEKTNKEMRILLIKRYLVHLVIIILTVIIFLPLLLFLCNKAYEFTVDSYSMSIQNFEKLYKQKQK